MTLESFRTAKATKFYDQISPEFFSEIDRQLLSFLLLVDLFVLLFNGISTFLGYLMPIPSFLKNSG